MRFVLIAMAVLAFAACRQEIVEEQFEPLDTYDRYRDALERLDLIDSVMGSAWDEAGRRALNSPTSVEAPIEEVLYFDPHHPDAVGYRFPLRRGRRVVIEIETETARYFADLYRVADDDAGDEAPVLVASRSEGAGRIELEARRDRFYVLRVQPELLRGGRFRIRITTEASLAFPVQDTGPESILSFYGDSRGGGTRIHEGVDIFAPRGTPLLAASDAVVYRVGERDRGGNIVSLRDEERDLLLYYAHLDEQLVTQGQRVSAGDVIGTVGNTGNAIHTPPHLHIGVYQGGWRNAVDPWEYIVDPPVTDPSPPDLENRIGEWFLLASDSTMERAVPPPIVPPRYVNRNPFLYAPGTAAVSELGLRETPTPEPATTVLPAETAVQVVGSSSDHVRVRTLPGETWLVTADMLVPAEESRTLPGGTVVRDSLSGDIITELADDSSVTVLGTATIPRVEAASNPGHVTVVSLDSGRIGVVTP